MTPTEFGLSNSSTGESNVYLAMYREQNKHELNKFRLTFARWVMLSAFLTIVVMLMLEVLLPNLPLPITAPVTALASNVITLVLGYYFGKGGD